METQMKALDTAYKRIVTRELPRPIRSNKEYELYLGRIEKLMEKAHRSAAESQYLELLAILVERYEEEHYPIRTPEPRVALRELMSANAVSQAEISRLLGSSGVTSEILSGKRELSKNQIRKLSQRFGVSPELFL
jgi:HTH-type transcriptional regulator/antitoxin HigA